MNFGVLFVFVAVATIVYAAPQDAYSNKYDDIDLDSILSNDRLLDNYLACLDESGKCTPEGEELKKYFKDGIETCCAKCNDKQKQGSKKVFNHLEKTRPEKLAQLKAKFDPTGEYEKACRKQLLA